MTTHPALLGLIDSAMYDIYRIALNPKKSLRLSDKLSHFITDLASHPDLPDDVVDHIQGEAISPHYGTLELTELEVRLRLTELIDTHLWEDIPYGHVVDMLIQWLKDEDVKFKPGANETARPLHPDASVAKEIYDNILDEDSWQDYTSVGIVFLAHTLNSDTEEIPKDLEDDVIAHAVPRDESHLDITMAEAKRRISTMLYNNAFDEGQDIDNAIEALIGWILDAGVRFKN